MTSPSDQTTKTRNPEGRAIGLLSIEVSDAVTGEQLSGFRYIVNEDNTGDAQVNVDEDQRDPSLFPSLRPGPSYSPVVSTGLSTGSSVTVEVPEGRHVVSVLSSGHKMGGGWVQVESGATTTLNVSVHPHPLPLSKVRVHVFHDDNPVNGEDDFPLESGLPGFLIVIGDTVGEVTVDYFGNPLGTQYELTPDGTPVLGPDGNPIRVAGTGGRVITDENGNAVIENLPPGKYEVQAIPPDGTDWIQTTTIEGTHVIDAWIEEGNDGYSPREGFKAALVWIGFVKPMEFGEPIPWMTGSIRGRVRTVIEFTPPTRPLTLGGGVDRPWIALSDIGANDQQVYTGRGDRNGFFSIEKVPAGTYQMAIWDEPLDHIISFRTVTVDAGQVVDLGDIGIPRWYGYINGRVFIDEDGDAIPREDDEGIPNVEVKTRFKDGSIQYSTVTDARGNYALNEVFELERFAVAEVDFTRLGQTGANATPDYGLSTENPSNPALLCMDAAGSYRRCSTTYPGALTLAALTWAAKTNRIDWGKKPYGPSENGGISGMVLYATTRNETDPAYAAAEDYEPGIPGVTVNLYATTTDSDGNPIQGQLINTTVTDSWEHPSDCIDPEGEPVTCTEVPNISNQIRAGVFDGGYAFDTYWDPEHDAPGAIEGPLTPGTYIVEVVPPNGYMVLDENGSVNTDQGDVFVAENTQRARPMQRQKPPSKQMPASRQKLPSRQKLDSGNGFDSGQALPAARMAPPPYYPIPSPPGIDTTKKVVQLVEGMNAATDFYLYTEVPVPGRIVGFLLDDVNIETDPSFIYYGEKRGIPNTPVGIRDFTGRLLTTVYSDINGIFEVLLPSTYTCNVPTPSGVAPAMYQVIGNDPGDPDNLDPHYNPNYQTLRMVFDVWPGKTTYADVALFPITAFVEAAGAQFSQPPQCGTQPEMPQLYRISRVDIDVTDASPSARTIEITGSGFGSTPGQVRVGGVPVTTDLWTDSSIRLVIPQNFEVNGPSQLEITSSKGVAGMLGITLHLLDPGENAQRMARVGISPDAEYSSIQAAIDNEPDGTLIIVTPGTYYESPILHKAVRLQGLGPGGILADGTTVSGSTIDGRFFLSYTDQWLSTLQAIDFDGPDQVEPDQVKEIARGQVLTAVARSGQFDDSFRPQVDGFMITGARGEEGGGIYINAHCDHLVISNNVIQSNGGGFGGGITIGKAYSGSCHNYDVRIHHNRILNNGGISLAGGIGIFNGANDYEIDSNEICGNYSAEYGGGISHFGYSPGGKIHHNRVLFNASFDEGAGIFVGGEQPTPPALLTTGSGDVSIYANLVQGNLANDDGGGIRLLQPLDYRINVYNNIIVNNVSTDLGGGIALDDASNVVIVNNTIAKNVTTATAEDSDGLPHAAGIVSERHSEAFSATLPPDSPPFSDPILFNNIIWDNRAGSFSIGLNEGRGGISGIGLPGDPSSVNVADIEVFGIQAVLSPRHCILTHPGPGGVDNVYVDPSFVEEYDTLLTAVAFNMEPDFRTVKIVTVTPELGGNYHLTAASPAIGGGVPSITVDGTEYLAPDDDYDGDSRPQGADYDIGADEATL